MLTHGDKNDIILSNNTTKGEGITMDSANIKKNIKKKRKLLRLTQKKLAEKLELGRSTVAMWETSGSTPPTEKLPQLASALTCSIDELFAEENTEDV